MSVSGLFPVMSSSPSRSSSPAVTANPNHQIPFNSAPVHHAPSPLGFGFGFGSSFGGNNGSPAPTSSASPMFGFGSASTCSALPSASSPSRRSEAKRRRDSDDADEDVDDDEDMGHSQQRSRLGSDSFNPSHEQKRMVLPKRIRAGLGFGPMMNHAEPFHLQHSPTQQASACTSASSSAFSPQTPAHVAQTNAYHASPSGTKRQALGQTNRVGMSGIDVDIGKMLASMDKPSLLSMLSSLLSQSKDATLPAQILSLLPTPSLDSVDASLDELEKAIRSSIPFVADGSSARHEYTWSRLRAPVAAFVDAALGYLPFFVTELEADKEERLRADRGLQADREEVHPATTFTFLLMLTTRVLRIEALLPSVTKSSLAFNLFTASSQPSFGFNNSSAQMSPTKADAYGKHSNLAYLLGNDFSSPSSPDALMTVLMPAILKQWTTLLHRLDKAVNGDGRMFSQEMVLTWARGLEATGSNGRKDVEMKAEEVLIRKAMDEVRNRLERDLAWLVGGVQHQTQTARGSTRKEKRGRGSSMSDGDEEL
ncbi:uncharacterized protein UDID_02488 [Ustilago sp. UG-2017a]|nr:uncharacterized protein UDID_02488 [Ustilago sp. UG-2017a]